MICELNPVFIFSTAPQVTFFYPNKPKNLTPSVFLHRAEDPLSVQPQSKEAFMEKKELKKLLAGLSLAGLVTGATLGGFGCATA
jgi:radical SAM modification target selenobiotic family peptide